MTFWLITAGVLVVVLGWAWWLDHRRRGTSGVQHMADDFAEWKEISEGEASRYRPPFGPSRM